MDLFAFKIGHDAVVPSETLSSVPDSESKGYDCKKMIAAKELDTDHPFASSISALLPLRCAQEGHIVPIFPFNTAVDCRHATLGVTMAVVSPGGARERNTFVLSAVVLNGCNRRYPRKQGKCKQ